MPHLTELNDDDFDAALKAAGGPLLVDFYTPWCGPCQVLASLLAPLARHYAGRIRFGKVNVDSAPELAARYGITGVPTLLFFRDGELRDRLVGFSSPRTLVDKLEALAGATEART